MDFYGVTNADGKMLSKDDINEMLEEIGISSDAIEDGSDSAIETDAQKLGIVNLDEQLTNLARGDGGKEIKGAGDTAKQDYETQLQTLGIPSDILIKGPNEVQAYAAQNNIRLPQASGAQFNIVS